MIEFEGLEGVLTAHVLIISLLSQWIRYRLFKFNSYFMLFVLKFIITFAMLVAHQSRT